MTRNGTTNGSVNLKTNLVELKTTYFGNNDLSILSPMSRRLNGKNKQPLPYLPRISQVDKIVSRLKTMGLTSKKDPDLE
mgnify:CR=1 FL=1|jgi:hypothetical protein